MNVEFIKFIILIEFIQLFEIKRWQKSFLLFIDIIFVTAIIQSIFSSLLPSLLLDVSYLHLINGAQSIPTIMAFRDGVLLFSQPGALPAASLDKLIASVREVDMVEVHKQIAEQETI